MTLNEPGFTDIASLFEHTAEHFAERPAIRSEDAEITYNHLNREANRVAHAILQETSGTPQRIALLFEQGIDPIAAMFGVLKAGCAFVPLDASNPAEKLIEICNSCKPALILTGKNPPVAAQEIAGSRTPVVEISQLPATLPETNPERSTDIDSLAYIFYTSGSTGKPKGVCQSQRNLFHFVRTYSNTLSISSRDHLSLLYSLGFSASNMDVFSALLNGATLYPYNIRKRGTAALATWLDQSEISILHTVPTVFRHLLAALDDSHSFQTVRGIDLGGETVFRSDIDLFKKHFTKECILINHLAATEASVIAQHQVDPSREYATEMLPVGQAADGVHIDIVGSNGEPAAPGQPGELIIRSPYVSTGYWKLPELTRKAFAKNEQESHHSAYRSADLGYRAENGEIYFLGRKDSRVKIRGYSVDTDEVEAAIRTCSSIQDTAVVARQTQPDRPLQLTAFFVDKPQSPVSPDDLRRQLARSVADYMIPAEFIRMDALPLTESGKIDRKSLAQLDRSENRPEQARPTPQTDTEHLIAALYSKILSIDPVGRHDDFFMLGGNSLQATEFHTLLEAAVSRQIPLKLFLENSTVSGLASVIDSQNREPHPTSGNTLLLPLRKNGTNPTLYMLHGLNGQAFVSPDFLKILGESQPVYAFQATGLETILNRQYRIEEAARLYVDEIRNVQPVGPYFIGAICSGGLIAIEMARLLRSTGETVAPLMLIDPPGNPPGDRPWLKRIERDIMLQIKFNFSRKHRERQIATVNRQMSRGRIQVDTSNQDVLKEALQTQLHLGRALGAYRVPVYAGPVLILGSRDRLSGKTGSLMKKLTGKVQVFDVADSHYKIHDVGNERFEAALRQCLEIIQRSLC